MWLLPPASASMIRVIRHLACLFFFVPFVVFLLAMSSLLEQLNPVQRLAAAHVDGPVLILAGAGSGKTRTIMYRIAHMVMELGIPAGSVLAVTFTNKAAKEMNERLHALCGHMAQGVTMGTFHSVCLRVLRSHAEMLGYSSGFTVYDTTDQKGLVKAIAGELGLDNKANAVSGYLAAISRAKNDMQTPAAMAATAETTSAAAAAGVYKAYAARLKASNAMDFDDILINTVELLREHPEVLERYQRRWTYLMVDEYQDTNQVQYELLRLLAGAHHNICVVGDDYQSIYSWRGADIRNILEFEQDYPNAGVYKLEQNYRSTGNIIKAAGGLIAKNERQKEKNLWTENPDGEKVTYTEHDNEWAEAEAIASGIKRLRREHPSLQWSSVALLYRTNAQSRSLEEGLLRHGIPYHIVGGLKFYDRKEIKDMLAYLRLAVNPVDDGAVERIINVPARGIGAKSLDQLRLIANLAENPLWEAIRAIGEQDAHPEISGAARRGVIALYQLVEQLRSLAHSGTAAEALLHAMKASGYQGMLTQEGDEGLGRLDNLGELLTVATKYNEAPAGSSVQMFLEEAALVSDTDNIGEGQGVQLMTLHTSKGLEFPVVFIPGFEEGIMPHSRSLLDPLALEEERRLLYVGMTRARERLQLLRARGRTTYGEFSVSSPSRFLDDIPSEYITDENRGERTYTSRIEQRASAAQAWEAGQRLRHAIWGPGRVHSVAGGLVTIIFEDPAVGKKTLATAVAPLEAMDPGGDGVSYTAYED